MNDIARITILMLTVIALIYILSHQPKPVVVTVIPYCEISLHIANKNIFGQYRYHWITDFGPCSLSDRYENV